MFMAMFDAACRGQACWHQNLHLLHCQCQCLTKHSQQSSLIPQAHIRHPSLESIAFARNAGVQIPFIIKQKRTFSQQRR
jgi:hypothetical protein